MARDTRINKQKTKYHRGTDEMGVCHDPKKLNTGILV